MDPMGIRTILIYHTPLITGCFFFGIHLIKGVSVTERKTSKAGGTSVGTFGVSMEVSNWRVYENCIIMEATVINISYNWRVTVSNCKVSNWCTSYTLQLLYENIHAVVNLLFYN